jgi:hypothetical protein
MPLKTPIRRKRFSLKTESRAPNIKFCRSSGDSDAQEGSRDIFREPGKIPLEIGHLTNGITLAVGRFDLVHRLDAANQQYPC